MKKGGAKSDVKKKSKITIGGNLPRVAKYLLTNEEKIFMIFDYEYRKKLNQIEHEKGEQQIEYNNS